MSQNYHLLFKYILVGDANCGKSSLLTRFIENKFAQNYEPTLGVEFGSKTFQVSSTIVKAMIWDTAGQETFKSIIRSYYKCAIIAILIFDISNKQSFENVQKWLEEIHMHGNEAIRIILIGNKSDLNDLGKRAVTTEEAELLAATNGFKYIQTSAKNGSGVSNCFMEPAKALISDIQSKKILLTANNESIGIKIGNPQNHKLQRQSIQISLKDAKKQGCHC